MGGCRIQLHTVQILRLCIIKQYEAGQITSGLPPPTSSLIMTQKFRLGMKGKLFQGPGGTTGVPATELSNVKDVTLTLDAAEADVTSRVCLM